MDPLQINKLKEEHQKGLHFCKENIAKWEKFKTDYEALKQRLETLPDCLSYDVTVPFGSNAFTKGKLVHTNEIMVLLGENWFAEVSAKQAAAIANRRITQCENMLEDLNKEKQQFENWLSYIGEVSGNEDLVEIVEAYDEEKEKSWREQHAKNVRSYRQQLAEKEKEKNHSDEDYLSKLEKLEISQSNGFEDSEENDDSSKSELDSKWAESVESVSSTVDSMDDGCNSEDQSEKPSLKLHINSKFWKTSESETGDDCEDNHKKDANANVQGIVSPKSEKHVRWQDLSSKQNIKKITFRHSKAKKQNSCSSKYKVIDSNEDENHPLIQSPSDIYKQFGNFFQSSPPKSILKVKTPSPSIDMNEPFFPTKDTVKESSPETDENIHSQPFTEVRERSCPINIVETKSSRPTSHFKQSRKNRRR